MQTEDEVAAVSDPGEIGREHHNKGDRFVVHVSNIAAWLFPVLVIAITAQVLMRNFGQNQAWLDDLQWWLYGAAVLVGVGYAVTTDSHVRVDIFYDNFQAEKRARVDLFALGWLFLPFIMLAWDVTFGYAQQSVASNEGSDSPNGLHNLWLLKIFMNLSFLFVAVACWSAIVRIQSKRAPFRWWRILWAAFPATFFTLNLMLYYGLWIVIWIVSPAGTSSREITRHDAFGEIPIGDYEFTYTTVIGLALAMVLVLALRLMDRSSNAGQG